VRVGTGEKSKDISIVIQTLNAHEGEEVRLDDILIRLLVKNITSSDILFLVLQNLEEDGYVKGLKGVIKILRKVDNEKTRELIRKINSNLAKNRKLFVTPLEVGKFYQCPRRLFLEKIVLAKQYKEEVGKTWDGEAIHLAINIFVKNLVKKDVKELISEAVKIAMDKYRGKITINEERLKDFLQKFYDFIKEENFSRIFTEKTFESFKIGLIGTPDLVCVKEDGSIVAIDIKLGRLDRKGIKKEHLLQIVGEAILIEDFFRKAVNSCYIIYFESDSLARVDINKEMKRRFLDYKRGIERICKFRHVPEKGKMPNLERRVCLGCHVRPSCENIEALQRIKF
jgi:CRISPR/Cas system-associated exonuclease Cas4 (RecB family)